MKFLGVAGMKGRWIPDLAARQVIEWFLSVCLIAGGLCPSFAADVNPNLDPARISAEVTAAGSGACRITVVGTSFWRDWMPIVSKPGPDGGSPLHVRVKLSVDNSTGGANKLSFRAEIVDHKGQSYSAPFRVLPNFRVLPDDVFKSYRTYDVQTKKAVDAKYNVMWDGGLDPGESREVELATAEGPYLPVGSSIHVRIEWTDKKGGMAVARTPDEPIKRTD
jgi:hypothetical protein